MDSGTFFMYRDLAMSLPFRHPYLLKRETYCFRNEVTYKAEKWSKKENPDVDGTLKFSRMRCFLEVIGGLCRHCYDSDKLINRT